MKHLFLAIVCCVTFMSCAKDDEPAKQNLDQYYFGYMHYPNGMLPDPQKDNLIRIEYSADGKVLKRIGGFLPVNQNAGHKGIFSNEVYYEVSYYEDSIVIVERMPHISNEISSQDFKQILTLDNKKRVTSRISIFPNYTDTVAYHYSDNRISKAIKKLGKDHFITSSYYFNNGNLDSIVTQQSNGSVADNERKVEVFSDYDNSINPFKDLGLFEENFYRSLSKNNYRRYDTFIHRTNGTVNHSFVSWTLHYENDQPDFSVF